MRRDVTIAGVDETLYGECSSPYTVTEESYSETGTTPIDSEESCAVTRPETL
ncbi:MAG: hypothetical protein Q4D55_09585 [Eubacteriales bacterium]|nr:hypothetical protein [Eubacteriales bacterium]